MFTSIYVRDWRFVGTGPLACLNPFSVMPWIRSDKCSNLRSDIPMFLMSRIHHGKLLTSSTSVLSFCNGGIISGYNGLTNLFLKGTSVTRLVLDPLAVFLLDNQLYMWDINMEHISFYSPFVNQINLKLLAFKILIFGEKWEILAERMCGMKHGCLNVHNQVLFLKTLFWNKKWKQVLKDNFW